MNLSDPNIIERIKKKDRNIITFLYQNYNDGLIFGAMKQGLAYDQAENVVQSTWCDFFEKAHRFEGRSHIRTYLFGMMKNKVRETFRSNLKYTKHDISEIDDASSDLVQKEIISKDLIQKVKEELEMLPKNQKEIFIKKELYGYTADELSKSYSIQKNNVAVMSFRTKKYIQQYLTKMI